MNRHAEYKRGFTQLSRAWYRPANLKDGKVVDEVSIGFYHPDGGTTREFQITWSELAGNIVPRLEVFDDGWHALFQFSDMLEQMAEVDGDNIKPDDFCKILVALGIEDMTKTERA